MDITHVDTLMRHSFEASDKHRIEKEFAQEKAESLAQRSGSPSVRVHACACVCELVCGRVCRSVCVFGAMYACVCTCVHTYSSRLIDQSNMGVFVSRFVCVFAFVNASV